MRIQVVCSVFVKLDQKVFWVLISDELVFVFIVGDSTEILSWRLSPGSLRSPGGIVAVVIVVWVWDVVVLEVVIVRNGMWLSWLDTLFYGVDFLFSLV